MIKITALPIDSNSIKLTSPFGLREISGSTKWHNGIDLGIAEGNNVYSVADGTVQVLGNDPDGYGKYIVIEHDSFCTLYAHLSKYIAQQGQTVKGGDKIALSGNTGASTGAHLHFEIRDCMYSKFWEKYGGVYGHCINSYPYIQNLQVKNSMDRDTAFAYIQSKVKLENATMLFLNSYIYRDELAIKLAKSIY